MRENKGITLIALIITIIILIILTAVTLNNVIGTDLIGFAGSAAGNYIDAEKEEEEKISELMSKGGIGSTPGTEEGRRISRHSNRGQLWRLYRLSSRLRYRR